MSQVCYSVFDESNCLGTFVCRKRRCVSDIFQELGPRYTRRSYRMNSIEFWTLYNEILPYYPKKEEMDDNKRVNTEENVNLYLQTVRYILPYIYALLSDISEETLHIIYE